jgi:mannose-6-phosphate isomerase-like protein (cupin superfamily)
MPAAPVPPSPTPDAIAPDGSEVRILAGLASGSMAQFTLPPGAIARAVVHRTVEELWVFISGAGRMWRADADGERIDSVSPGLTLAIPVGTRFQFRADGDLPLVAVGTTMPPWPGPEEAVFVEGPWAPTA